MQNKAVVLDSQTIEHLRSIRRPDGNTLLDRVATLYQGESAELIADLQAAVDTLEAETVRQLAHRFKSVSGSVGALGLSRSCAELELMAGEGNLEQASASLAEMVAQHESVLEALAAELR